MKKRLPYLFIAIVSICATLLTVRGCSYYGSVDEQAPYPCSQYHDDTLRLIIIGDSWAFMHQPYDNRLARLIQEKTGRPTSVRSFGICGYTSKDFYLATMNDERLKAFLTDGADYCFISLGINDTYKKTGADLYATHTAYLLRFLLHNHIRPILMEIPDYDIDYAYQHQTPFKKALRQLSIRITDSQMDCRNDYRQALQERLRKDSLTHQILLVPSQNWNMDLYQPDRMHLNEKGYAALDSCIANLPFIIF